MQERYYVKYAAAVVRGALIRQGKEKLLSDEAMKKPLCELCDEDYEEIFKVAKENQIKLYHFKKSDRTLPRVKKVLGFLRGIYFESLCDVGSGRGVFLLPFMEEFPNVKITSLDILQKRVDMLSDISRGGIDNLNVKYADICDTPLAEKSHDVMTMLEVLEHIPNVEAAIAAAVKIARKYIVITVPSKEDDNPKHIHLLTKALLSEIFTKLGVRRLSFDGVSGHLFMIATIPEE